MSEIIGLRKEEQEKQEPKEELSHLIQGLTKIKESESFSELITLISETPEAEFKVLSPLLLDELEKSLKDPKQKQELKKGLVEVGITIENVESLLSAIPMVVETLFGNLKEYQKTFFQQAFNILFNSFFEATEGDKVVIPIELCHKDAKIPTYAREGDAGMDVYALEDYRIDPGETVLIPTGIKIAIPVGYEIQVRPKSGRALKTKLRIANTPGTIDSGYRSEVGIIVENIEAPIKDIGYHSDENGIPVIESILHGEPYYILKGEKFAQLVLCKVYNASFNKIDDISAINGDRGGGFGSTGLK